MTTGVGPLDEIPEIPLNVGPEFVPHIPQSLQRCIDSGLNVGQIKAAMEMLARGECLVTWRWSDGTRFWSYTKKR
jgi:hypothetical protein